MSSEPKHHYIPVFYLKQWAQTDGQICEFSRPYKEVKPRRTYPDGTGYVRGLYTFRELSAEMRNALEEVFLLRADDLASVALRRLLAHQVQIDADLKSAWSRFIMTLLFRNPESIQRIVERVAIGLPSTLDEMRKEYDSQRSDGDPRTFTEFATSFQNSDLQRFTQKLLKNMMDNRRIGSLLNTMIWSVVTFECVRYPLLTSDRPYVMTNGLDRPDGHLVLPISPDTIFIATRTSVTTQQILADCNRKKLRMNEVINNVVARQSHRYVWSTTDAQLRFVATRLGQRQLSVPTEI